MSCKCEVNRYSRGFSTMNFPFLINGMLKKFFYINVQYLHSFKGYNTTFPNTPHQPHQAILFGVYQLPSSSLLDRVLHTIKSFSHHYCAAVHRKLPGSPDCVLVPYLLPNPPPFHSPHLSMHLIITILKSHSLCNNSLGRTRNGLL